MSEPPPPSLAAFRKSPSADHTATPLRTLKLFRGELLFAAFAIPHPGDPTTTPFRTRVRGPVFRAPWVCAPRCVLWGRAPSQAVRQTAQTVCSAREPVRDTPHGRNRSKGRFKVDM